MDSFVFFFFEFWHPWLKCIFPLPLFWYYFCSSILLTAPTLWSRRSTDPWELWTDRGGSARPERRPPQGVRCVAWRPRQACDQPARENSRQEHNLWPARRLRSRPCTLKSLKSPGLPAALWLEPFFYPPPSSHPPASWCGEQGGDEKGVESRRLMGNNGAEREKRATSCMQPSLSARWQLPQQNPSQQTLCKDLLLLPRCPIELRPPSSGAIRWNYHTVG